MAEIFVDGFDMYGPAGQSPATLAALMAGMWTTSTSIAIVAPLSALGWAVNITGSSAAMSKTLPASYARIIGGCRFSSNLASGAGLTFRDAGTAQVSVVINTTGTVSVATGILSGTALATSAASVAANAVHYLEWDLTIGASAAYQVWLDGVSLFSGTGNTRGGTANNSINGVLASILGGSNSLIIDDMYLFDTTGSNCNAVALTNPVVETQFAVSDSSVQFTASASVVGNYYQLSTGSTSAPGANQLALIPITPQVNMTINSVSFIPGATSVGANFKPAIYSDSAGAAGTLLSGGSQVTGATSGTTIAAALTTPQALTAGTQYWIGYITDTSVVINTRDALLHGYKAASTYASGVPGTAPAMTSGQATYEIWGNCTGAAHNYAQEDNLPPADALAFNSSSTVGNEDLFNYPALSTTPNTIYTVQVLARVLKTDAGTRTMDLRMKSGSTDSAGSNAGQTPAQTYGWLGSFFANDPNTGVAWTASGLNSATSGYKIAS